MPQAAGIQRETIYIVIAVICGVAGIFLVREYVEGKLDEYRKQLANAEEVLQATKRMGTDTVVTEDSVKVVPVPRKFLHSRAVRKLDLPKILGRRLSTPVDAGEVLLWYQMDMGRSATVSERISEDKKGVTLAVSTITGAAGLLRPNMRVDLYATYRVPDKPGEAKDGEARPRLTAVLLQPNVSVLAVGAAAGGTGGLLGGGEDSGEYSSITVLVDTKDVERMLLASELTREQGTSIYCVLRDNLVPIEATPVPKPMTEDDFLQQLLGRARGKE
jgi:pilus assembly protein CpaB